MSSAALSKSIDQTERRVVVSIEGKHLGLPLLLLLLLALHLIKRSGFEFSLCLSRACLGKIIILYINGFKETVFMYSLVLPVALRRPLVQHPLCPHPCTQVA